MAYRHFPISLVFPVATAAGTGSMIAVIGILIALAAGSVCACYFGFRSGGSPAARPTSPAKKPASFSAALTTPSDDASAEPDTAPATSEPAELGVTPPPLATARKLVRAGKGPFADTRRHPRTEFLGTATATIYPHDSRQTSVPVQCLVDTRDLSCNGIGIGHTQQLYPSQMIVIRALGKLLVAEIRWCHRIDSHYYIAGARLVKAAT
jgi:hypothetical protein